MATEQQAFPKFALVNCHPVKTIFSVVPEGHEHRPIGSVECIGDGEEVCHVFSDGPLQPRYDAMQKILRRSNAYDELVAALEHFVSSARDYGDDKKRYRHSVNVADAALAKARGES